MPRSAKSRAAIIDGSNVAHSTEGGVARLENIRLVEAKVREEGMEPIVVVDAALRYQIDDQPGYDAMVESGEIRQAPAGTDADYFILTFAKELNARIVSNDRFRDRSRHFPRLRDRVIRFMIVDGEVVLERRNHHRKHP